MAIYTKSDFVLQHALSGVPVVPETSDISDEKPFESIGILEPDTSRYKFYIKGQKYRCDSMGLIMEGPDHLGEHLKLVTASMSYVYGSSQNMTRGVGEGFSTIADISVLEPRDAFAVQALGVMMSKMEHPEAASDAMIMLTSRAAYSWAQGMMLAAADYRSAVREREEPEPSDRTEVDLTNASISEKLLSNLVESIDDLSKQVKASLGAPLKVDNPESEQGVVDKFQVEGAGGDGGLDYDKLNDIGQNVSGLPAFNNKALGRTSIDSVLTKMIASLSATQKQSLYDTIKDKMQTDFDAKGAADTALASAKQYTDEEIAKKHPNS